MRKLARPCLQVHCTRLTEQVVPFQALKLGTSKELASQTKELHLGITKLSKVSLEAPETLVLDSSQLHASSD